MYRIKNHWTETLAAMRHTTAMKSRSRAKNMRLGNVRLRKKKKRCRLKTKLSPRRKRDVRGKCRGQTGE